MQQLGRRVIISFEFQFNENNPHIMTNHAKSSTAQAEIITVTELTSFDRIWLHLRCLARDHKFRWHWAGIWREVRHR